VEVLKATPTIATDASRTVPSGGPVSDKATLANGFNPTGTMTFNLYGPNDPTCSSAPVFTWTVPVDGNGVYNSGVFETTAPGTYKWVASYSGDVNNNPVNPGCNAPFETVVVTPQIMTGRAYGAKVDLLAPLLPPTPDTGPISTTNPGTFAPPCTISLNPILNAGVLCASVVTSTNPPRSSAQATVASADILTGIVGVPEITVTGVQASSTTECSGSAGRTTIARLTIGGLPVDVSSLAPNTTLNLVAAVLTLNEQIPVAGADHGLTVNAVHLIVPKIADIVLASATSDIHNCFPPVVHPAPLPVFAGYADRVRAPAFAPNPWIGAPNTTWVGQDALNLTDTGAIRIDNPGTTPIDGVHVTVDVGPAHYDLWGVNSVPANGHLLLFQTVPLESFDTSDAAPGPNCTESFIIPVIHVSANGFTYDYKDVGRALTSGGVDKGNCFNIDEGVDWTPTAVMPTTPSKMVVTDFDGDNRTDISVFRPSAGTWFVHPSTGGLDQAVVYGAAGDIPVPADYDGDNRTDEAIFRPSSGLWAIRPSLGGPSILMTYGVGSDIPVPADYDGDHIADIAVYRNGTWFVHPSSGGPNIGIAYGAPGDVPVIGDYDGDLRTDVGIYRPSTGLWAIHLSGGGDIAITYGGLAGDVPVPGDYDGDTRTDVAIFRPSLGAWFVHKSSDGTDVVTTFGIATDKTLQLPASVRMRYFP
jgi:hypothetical protein